jgi:murein DD-endopeptidase MepM/ murein hydrolase activator NlpD
VSTDNDPLWLTNRLKTIKICLLFTNNFSINLSFKHFLVRASLSILRGLIVTKRYGILFLQKSFQPVKSVGFILLKVVGVPAYRAVFFVRRSFSAVLLPAKSRFFYIFSNRYSIHVFVVVLMIFVGTINIKTQNVRAETFGQKTVLYSLVAVDDSETVETVEAGKEVLLSGQATTYLADAISITWANRDMDFLTEEEIAEASTPLTTQSRQAVETYVVKEGDTLGKIALHYNLSIGTILSANKLSLRSTIRPGDTLKILPTDGVLYTVGRGDTISKIARTYKVEEEAIFRANRITKDHALQIGDELMLPGAEVLSVSSAIARRPVSVKDIFVPKGTGVATGWVWPTNWHIITQYYSWKHTGIDIDGDYSTFSFAAYDGVVSYTGWRKGYGLTVEVEHGNGLKTRYAHNSKILVSVGDVVSAGERLAQTGSTGRSTGTHLHFEVIKNGKFQNPLDYVR